MNEFRWKLEVRGPLSHQGLVDLMFRMTLRNPDYERRILEAHPEDLVELYIELLHSEKFRSLALDLRNALDDLEAGVAEPRRFMGMRLERSPTVRRWAIGLVTRP